MGLHIPPSLHYRRFRLLWIGLGISIAGSQMQLWSLFWHIRELTDQPIALGGIGLARIVPLVVFSLIGGAIADVTNRRKVMFLTQSAMALVAVALGLLTLSGSISLWQIYALTAVQAVAAAFDLPARQALVPNLLPPKDLPNAFSMTSIAFQTGSIVGPALSGLVIASLGLQWVYFINAFTYLAVIWALLAMGSVHQEVQRTSKSLVSVKAIQEGVQFIIGHPIILSTMLMDFIATFFSSANTLMPIIARDVLKVGPVEYGWLSSAQSIGAMVAAVVISQLKEIRRQGQIFLIAVVFFGAATVVFGFARSMLVAMLALIVVGASDSVSTIIRNTIRQLQTPDYIRGRMVSVNQIFFAGGPQLGEIEAGVVAQVFGAPLAVISGGIACVVAVAAIARRWPVLREYNGDEPVLAGGSAGIPAD
ncbi:MAG: MFS transporter [Anaerolineales bacterium]|jgi:MFS family permease